MQYNEERVRERMSFILAKHEIARHKFASLALLPESSVRGVFSGRHHVNLDFVYRLILVHLPTSTSNRAPRIVKAMFDVLLSEEYKDESLLILMRCTLRQLTWSEINPNSCHAYYDHHLGQHLRAMRTIGYKLSYRSMSFMEFAPSYTTIKAYEEGRSRPTLDYFFGLLLKFKNPAVIFLYVMAPVGKFRAPGINLRTVALYQRYLKIDNKERKRLMALAHASNTTRKGLK